MIASFNIDQYKDVVIMSDDPSAFSMCKCKSSSCRLRGNENVFNIICIEHQSVLLD